MSASSKKKLRKELNAAAMTEKQLQEQKETKKLRLYTTIFAVAIAVMILVVIVTMIADFVIALGCENLPYETVPITWPVVLFPLVTMWYILTETGSIIENAISMGARVPQWLPRLLNATVTAIDSAVSE